MWRSGASRLSGQRSLEYVWYREDEASWECRVPRGIIGGGEGEDTRIKLILWTGRASLIMNATGRRMSTL